MVDNEAPVVTDVQVTPNPSPANSEVTLTATIDDTSTGNSNIAFAEYNLNGGDWIEIYPVDATFDSPTEEVFATLWFTESQYDTHTICVRGSDVFNNISESVCTELTIELDIVLPPDIQVSPLSHDFGNVQWGQSSTAIFTITNVGSGKLTIDDIYLDVFEAFSITSDPSLPGELLSNESTEVEITFSPYSLQLYTDVLYIGSNDPDNPSKVIPLSGTGVINDTFSEQVSIIIDYIEDSIEDGTLEGVGPGRSANNKVNALINMIKSAGDLLESGQMTEGCQQLADIYLKVDGVSPPPDFVTGEAREGLADLIEGLMIYSGCQ